MAGDAKLSSCKWSCGGSGFPVAKHNSVRITQRQRFSSRPAAGPDEQRICENLPNEVMTVGDINSTERPQDRSDVALFYGASSPTQVFNQAAQQVAQQRAASLT